MPNPDDDVDEGCDCIFKESCAEGEALKARNFLNKIEDHAEVASRHTNNQFTHRIARCYAEIERNEKAGIQKLRKMIFDEEFYFSVFFNATFTLIKNSE